MNQTNVNYVRISIYLSKDLWSNFWKASSLKRSQFHSWSIIRNLFYCGQVLFKSTKMSLSLPQSVTKQILSFIHWWKEEVLDFLMISVFFLYSKYQVKWITLHTDCHRVMVLRKRSLKFAESVCFYLVIMTLRALKLYLSSETELSVITFNQILHKS